MFTLSYIGLEQVLQSQKSKSIFWRS